MGATLLCATARGNPHLDRAQADYDRFRYEQALEELGRAQEGAANSPADEVRIALLEGMVAAELALHDRALRAFQRALTLDPRALLPDTVSPKVADLFQRAQRELAPAPTSREASRPPGGLGPAGPALAAPEAPIARRTGQAPSGLRAVVAASAVVDVPGRSVGADVSLGIGGGAWEGAAAILLGKQTGIALEASRLFGPAALRFRVGLRGLLFPGAGALGGGLVVGVRVRVFGAFCLVLDTGAYLVSAPPPYRSFAWLLAAGVAFDPAAAHAGR